MTVTPVTAMANGEDTTASSAPVTPAMVLATAEHAVAAVNANHTFIKTKKVP